MACIYLACMRKLLLLTLGCLVLSSCKEEEPVDPYIPLAQKVIGKWVVHASTTANGNVTEDYPDDIDESYLDFRSNSEIIIKIVCNQGKANAYLVSETGSIYIRDVSTTNVVCSNASLSQVWTNRILNTLDAERNMVINGNQMTLYGTDDFSISLTKQ